MDSQMQNVGRMDLKQCFFGGLFGGEVGRHPIPASKCSSFSSVERSHGLQCSVRRQMLANADTGSSDSFWVPAGFLLGLIAASLV